MKIQAFLAVLIVMAAYAHASPALSAIYPADGSFVKGGSINFTINASSVAFNASSAVLFVISKSAFDQGEAWDRLEMQCFGNGNYTCSKLVSFAIAGSDTLEYFYFEGNDTDGTGAALGSRTVPLRFTLDRNPPLLSFVLPKNNTYVFGSNVTIEITATDGASGPNLTSIQFSFDKVSWENTSSGKGYWNSTTYADNTTLKIYARAYDNTGNAGEADINVTIDNEVPRLIVQAPFNGATISGMYIFQMQVDDNFSGISQASIKITFAGRDYSMTCASGEEYNCSASIDTSILSDAVQQATFIVSDNVGNFNRTTVSVNTKNSKPSISFNTANNSLLRGIAGISVGISRPDGVIANVTLAVDSHAAGMMSCNNEFTSCNYNLDTSRFSDGNRTLTATAATTLGYTVQSSIKAMIDNTNANIVITAPQYARGLFNVSAIVLDDNADENKVTASLGSASKQMSCSAQGKALSCSAVLDSTIADDGPGTIYVSVVDKAGNSYKASSGITVDNKPPEFLFIKIEPLQIDTGETIKFTAGISDAGSDVRSAQLIIAQGQFRAVLDMQKLSSTAWYYETEVANNGGYYVSVKAEDMNENSITYDKKGYFYAGMLPCGDNTCQDTENYCLCPADCGNEAPQCAENSEARCISGIAECVVEDTDNVTSSACGDRICSDSESCSLCSTDCGSCESIEEARKTIQAKNAPPVGDGGIGEIFSPTNLANNLPQIAAVVVIIVGGVLVYMHFRKKPFNYQYQHS